jgi:hypothetical protein
MPLSDLTPSQMEEVLARLTQQLSLQTQDVSFVAWKIIGIASFSRATTPSLPSRIPDAI